MTNIAEYAKFFKEYYKNSPKDGGISLNISIHKEQDIRYKYITTILCVCVYKE